MNKIVIELCEEDRTRLDRIISGLEILNAASAKVQMDNPAINAVAAEHPAGESTTHLEPTVAAPDAPAPEPAPAPEVKTVSKGEFQKAIVVRCAESPVMKAKVQALVHRYATSVSAIPEDKRAEVLAELAKL